jgi:hypothetical protein
MATLVSRIFAVASLRIFSFSCSWCRSMSLQDTPGQGQHTMWHYAVMDNASMLQQQLLRLWLCMLERVLAAAERKCLQALGQGPWGLFLGNIRPAQGAVLPCVLTIMCAPYAGFKILLAC